MKRSWCLGLWMGLIGFTILAIPFSRIHAANPTPTTAATTPDPLQGVLEVPEGIPITSMSISGSRLFGSDIFARIDFNLQTTLAKLGFNVPDFKVTGMLQRIENGVDGLTDQYVKDHETDPGGKFRYSAVFEYCPTPAPGETTAPTPMVSRLVTDVNDQGKDIYYDAKKAGSLFIPQYSLAQDANGNFLQAPQDIVVAISPTPGCNINENGIPASPTPIPIIESGILASLTRVFIKLFPQQTSVQATSAIVGATVQTGDKVIEKLLPGEDDKYLTYAGEPTNEIAEDQQAAGGLYDTFLLAKPTTSYASNQQPLSTSITTNTVGGKVLDDDTAFDCAITQEGDPDRPPPSACPGEVANPTTSPSSGDVCAVADKYHIPCCQLEGIMRVESGGGSGTCSRDGETCCIGNFCGPANISCNQYSGLDSGDNLKMCTDTGAAELLARAMLIALCQADANTGKLPAPAPVGTCERYNWSLDGNYILKYYKIADGDYTAAAYYYGLGHGCAVDACSQFRWGAGKGYCDAVAGQCPGGTPLVNSTDVSFCNACNQTIPSGSPKINCSEYR